MANRRLEEPNQSGKDKLWGKLFSIKMKNYSCSLKQEILAG